MIQLTTTLAKNYCFIFRKPVVIWNFLHPKHLTTSIVIVHYIKYIVRFWPCHVLIFYTLILKNINSQIYLNSQKAKTWSPPDALTLFISLNRTHTSINTAERINTNEKIGYYSGNSPTLENSLRKQALSSHLLQTKPTFPMIRMSQAKNHFWILWFQIL